MFPLYYNKTHVAVKLLLVCLYTNYTRFHLACRNVHQRSDTWTWKYCNQTCAVLYYYNSSISLQFYPLREIYDCTQNLSVFCPSVSPVFVSKLFYIASTVVEDQLGT